MQIYYPEHESLSGPHFVVYLDRRQMHTHAIRFGRIAVLALFSLCMALFVMFSQLHNGMSSPLIFDVVATSFAPPVMIWRAWQFFQLSSKEEPVLIINHE